MKQLLRRLAFMLALLFGVVGWTQVVAQVLNEGFEDTEFPPSDWTTIHVSGSESWGRYTSNKNSGSASASVNYASAGHENYLITPKLVPATSETLSFYVSAASYGGTTLKVEISTTGNEAADFTTELATYTTGSSGTIGTTSNSTFVQKTIDLSDYVGQEIYVAFHVIDNDGGRICIDDVSGVTLFVPSCPKPTALTIANITTNSADLSWTAGGSETAWDIDYSTNGETWTPIATTTNPYTLTGLTANTAYQVRVRSHCSDIDQSDYTGAKSFRTECTAYTISADFTYTMGFESSEGVTSGSYSNNYASFIPCWSMIKSSNYPYVNNSTYSAHTDTCSLYFYGGSTTAVPYAIMPSVTNDLNTLRLSFWYKTETSSSYGYLEVGVMTDPTDASTFDTVRVLDKQSNYTKVVIDFTDVPANGYIAFRYAGGTSTYGSAYVDDITLMLAPSCMDVTEVAVANISTTTADISWTAGGSETAWDIDYSTDGETWTPVAATTNPFTLTDLTANTAYQVRVRSHCSDTDLGAYTDAISFRTECDAVSQLPWTEDFESYNAVSYSSEGNMPSCWDCYTTSSTKKPHVTNGTSYNYPHSGANTLSFYGGSSNGNPFYAVLPEFDAALNTLQLTFWTKMESVSYGTLSLGYITSEDDGTMKTFVEITTFVSVGTLTQYEVMLSALPATAARLVFKWNSSSQYVCCIDDVVVDELPSCFKPSALNAANMTPTTADISWTAGGSETAWDIDYSTDGETWTPVAATTNPFTLTDLTANTAYQVRVRAHCSDIDQSDYTKAISFRTECDAVSQLPWSEDFSENIYCWNTITTNSYPKVSSNQLYFTSVSDATAVLPEFTADLNTLEIMFRYKSSSSTYYQYNKLILGAMSDKDSINTFVALDTLDYATDMTDYDFVISGVPAGYHYLAIRYAGGTSTSGSAYIDDVEVKAAPTCFPLRGLNVSNIARREMLISIDENEFNATHNYELVISSAELDANALESATKIELNDTAIYQATGLTRGTTYYIYARANCGDTDKGEWMSTTATTKSLTGQAEIIVADGTKTNSYIPVYGNYCDYVQRTQTIYPASMLTELVGESISGLHYYVSSGSNAGAWDNATFNVKMAITEQETLETAFATETMTTVYSGTLTANTTDGMRVTFATPFTYTGGNLLIEFELPVETSYISVTFFGVTVDGGPSRYEYEGYSSWTGASQNFLPKTGFIYTYAHDPCPAVETVTVSDILVNQATINWSASTGDYANEYDVLISETEIEDFSDVVPTYANVAGLSQVATGLLEYTDYYVYVRAICNGEGQDDGSSTWFGTTFKTMANCRIVTDLTAAVTGKTTATATWTPGQEGQNYLYVLSDTELDETALAQAQATSLDTNYLEMTALNSETTYYLYVAGDCGGDASSPYVSTSFVTPQACPKVENLSVSNIQFNCVTLSWNRGWFGDETEWTVSNGVDSYTAHDSTFLFFGLDQSTEYTFYVTPICGGEADSIQATTAVFSNETAIGTGTSSDYAPVCGFYGYERNAYLFTADDGLSAGTISSIAWRFTDAKTIPATIYLMNTTATSLSALYAGTWNEAKAGATEVYTGSVTTANDWVTLDITPFQYTGNGLVVLVASNYGGSGGGGVKAYYTMGPANSHVYAKKDGSINDDAALSSNTSHGLDKQRHNVRFGFVKENSCTYPVQSLAASDITTEAATITWTPAAMEKSWETYLSTSIVEDVTTIVGSTVNATVWNISGLTNDVDYYAYVRPTCDENSEWSYVHFVTVANCKTPTNLHVDSLSNESAVVCWSTANTIADQGYDVVYGVASTFDLDNNTTYQMVAAADTFALLTELLDNTTYTVAVRANCEGSVDSRWSDEIQFLTNCDAVAKFPWSENFDERSIGLFEDNCWINEHISGDGAKIFQVADGQSTDTTHTLQLPDMSAGTQTMLVLPAMNIPEANAYQFRMNILRNASGTYKAEGIRVFMSTRPEIDSTATEMGFISRNREVADTVHGIPAEPETGWYLYEFTIPMAGEMYIILRGESQYGSSTYMDDLMVRQIPSCTKPLDLTVAPLVTTATATWTGNAANYIVVVYDDNQEEVFNTTVDTSAVLITNLTSNSQYSMTVQGDCGGGDLSDIVTTQFRTATDLPFAELFTSGVPDNWSIPSANVDEVLAGTAALTGNGASWSQSSKYPNSVKMNLYNTKTNWLITPTIVLTAEEGQDITMFFDAAHSGYNNTNAIAYHAEDRLEVLISTDGGVNWTRMDTWRVTGGDHNISEITNVMQTFRIDLTAYANQAVQLAFYGGRHSSSTSPDADLVIGNVKINAVAYRTFTFSTCQLSGELAAQTEIMSVFPEATDEEEGEFVLTHASEVTPATPVLMLDTLNLTVYFSINTEYYPEVYVGDHYVDEYFDIPAIQEGDEEMYGIEEVTVHGCDSVILPTFIIHNAQTIVTDSTIAPGESVEWGDQICTTAGTYVDTVYTARGGVMEYRVLNLTVTGTGTGLGELSAEELQSAQKVVYNERLYIVRGREWFDASGHRITDPRK